MRHFEIYGMKSEYATFPSIARAEGDIYVAFRVTEGDNSETHVDTRSRGMILRLDEESGRWRHFGEVKARNEFSGVQEVAIMDSPPSLYWFEWRSKSKAHTKDPRVAVVRGGYRANINFRSGESGKRSVLPAPKLAISHAPKRGGDMQDIIIPAYGDIGDGYSRCVGVNDKGFWTIASEKGIDFCEPCLVWRPKSRHVFCLFRGERGNKSWIYQAHSYDFGRSCSWTSPAKTGIEGEGAHVIRLEDGRLLCTYGHRKRPYGIRACYSYDEGITWDHEDFVTIRDDGGGRDIGYPKSLELEGGLVLTVYYFYTQEDETRRILGSVWRPE